MSGPLSSLVSLPHHNALLLAAQRDATTAAPNRPNNALPTPQPPPIFPVPMYGAPLPPSGNFQAMPLPNVMPPVSFVPDPDAVFAAFQAAMAAENAQQVQATPPSDMPPNSTASSVVTPAISDDAGAAAVESGASPGEQTERIVRRVSSRVRRPSVRITQRSEDAAEQAPRTTRRTGFRATRTPTTRPDTDMQHIINASLKPIGKPSARSKAARLNVPSDATQETDPKARKRAYNRQTSETSRARKKAYQESLESEVKRQLEIYKSLKLQIKTLEEENDILRQSLPPDAADPHQHS